MLQSAAGFSLAAFSLPAGLFSLRVPTRDFSRGRFFFSGGVLPAGKVDCAWLWLENC